MPTPLQHLHGHWYFTDLHTPDVDGATAFYTALFGWSTTDIEGGPFTYRMADIDGRTKAGMTGLPPEQAEAGVPPHWLAYLTVADIDAAVARVAELGGAVMSPIMDVMDQGRMAVAQDPTGATFGIWQDVAERTTVLDEHGSPFWYELHSTDIEASLPFYAGLVGWEYEENAMGELLTYFIASTPSTPDPQQQGAAGLMQQMPSPAGSASAWRVYFNVDDADAMAHRAVELGGSIVMGPHDIPGVGRSVALADPQGAEFTAMTPLPRTG